MQGDFKDAKAIIAAFGRMLTASHPRNHRRLQTDKNKERFNSDFQALMKRQGIQHFSSKSDQQSVVVQRVNRNIKTKT